MEYRTDLAEHLDDVYVTEQNNGECLECGQEIEEGAVYCSDCEKWLYEQGFFE